MSNKIEELRKQSIKEWDESKHPRDKIGRFATKSEQTILKKIGINSLSNDSTSGKIKGAKAKAMALKGKPEGTYDLLTGEPISYDSGYQVSFQQSSDTYTDDEYDTKVDEVSKKTGSKPNAGVYGGDPEVSFRVADLEEAMKITEEYNQESIFDWESASRGDWDNAFKINEKYDATKNKTHKEI